MTASKLCARKRPHFFPVRDSVVTQLVLGLGQVLPGRLEVYRHLLADRELMAELSSVAARASELSDRPIGDSRPAVAGTGRPAMDDRRRPS